MTDKSNAGQTSVQPLVSVIVPIYEPDMSIVSLARCLTVQTYAHDHIEVLLVDDGSPSDGAKVAFDAALDVLGGTLTTQLLRQSNAGSYSARNTGISAARGDLLVFTDADCLPRPDWIAEHVSALAAGKADLVAGDITMTRSDDASETEWYDSLLGLPQQWFAQTIGFAATANLSVTRACMDVVQGFDPSLRSGGDQEFCDRARRQGFKLGYSAAASVIHPARIGFDELARKTRRVAKGRADAYPSMRYLLPQGFGALVRQRNPELARHSPRHLGWKLRMLHARLEWIRIGAYIRQRLKHRISREG